MPCPHNEITIVQRSQRQSAVAAAAYQSGEKLFCEYDQQVKHYPEKRGIVHNEILLPANAPRSYADRNTLWNAAEAVEKQWNSQLARRWVLTIPREIPPDQYAVLVREFCEQQFVSKGMIADFAIHDPHPPGHNPHAHVMLTMRAMDEHGKWLPKSRKVYDLDENGERIKLPSGRWKSHKEDKLQQIDGRGYSSIHSIRGVLRPAFQMAVDDDLLRKNPFEFELASVIVNDSVTREAITRKQQRDLLKFIQEDKHFSRYYDAIYILFHTGLRISEFCGLTISEIEFGEMRIKVDHQLQRTAQMQYVIEEPKTDKGIRYVPMTEAVAACFRRIIANRKTPKVEPMVEGYAGFLFLDKNDMPMVALHWEKYMEHIIQKYNRIYRIQMPKVTPHVCRHTFCSNMAKSGMNPKTLQYIMGHADISVTLNTYTHVNFDDAKEEVYRIANS